VDVPEGEDCKSVRKETLLMLYRKTYCTVLLYSVGRKLDFDDDAG
jgi:hypothetical protein